MSGVVDHFGATYGFLKHFDTKLVYLSIYQKPKSLLVWVGETWLRARKILK